jgi:hypothetical protein
VATDEPVARVTPFRDGSLAVVAERRPQSPVRCAPAGNFTAASARFLLLAAGVTFRITSVSSDEGRPTLRLAGRLGAREVPVLDECARAGAGALDLKDLISADADGIAALRRLRDRGLEVRNASHSVAMLLG